MTKKCEAICADCPFRRDSTRLKDRDEDWPDPAEWLARHAWPSFEPPECPVEAATCLGWAVYVANGSAACMVASTHRDWVASWAKDTDLIFDGNAEFTRYHRGEHFGSEDWKSEDTISGIETGKRSYEFNEQGQGSLL